MNKMSLRVMVTTVQEFAETCNTIRLRAQCNPYMGGTVNFDPRATSVVFHPSITLDYSEL